MIFPLGLGPISPTTAALQATPSLDTSHLVGLPTSVTPLQLHTPSVILKMYVCFPNLFRALSLPPPVPQLFTHNQNEFLFPKAVQGTLSHPSAPQLSALKNQHVSFFKLVSPLSFTLMQVCISTTECVQLKYFKKSIAEKIAISPEPLVRFG